MLDWIVARTYPRYAMETLRTSLHLVLALTLASLTCGISAFCASMGESCCCMTENDGSPCTEMSDSGDAPVSPAPASTIESGERFSIAIVDASPIAASLGGSASSSDRLNAQASLAAPTPLYLSHCAFLC